MYVRTYAADAVDAADAADAVDAADAADAVDGANFFLKNFVENLEFRRKSRNSAKILAKNAIKIDVPLLGEFGRSSQDLCESEYKMA